MEFKKFTSLENTYREKTVNCIKQEHIWYKGDWIVMEKIHGANFSFYYEHSTGEVHTGSRNQFVDGSFYNCRCVVDRYTNDIKEISQTLHDYYGCDLVTIYGELYGEGVQKGVSYGEKDFKVFDVQIDGIAIPISDAIRFVNETDNLEFCPIIGVFKTLEEALSVNETFQSKLTPEGFDGDNFAEGVTIVPDKPLYFSTGSRAWLKKKTDKFSEKSNKKQPKPKITLTDCETEALNNFLSYININRVESVISKVGEIDSKMFGKVMGLTVQDALEDISKDLGLDCSYKDHVGEEVWKRIKGEVNKNTSEVVREFFLKHI